MTREKTHSLFRPRCLSMIDLATLFSTTSARRHSSRQPVCVCCQSQPGSATRWCRAPAPKSPSPLQMLGGVASGAVSAGAFLRPLVEEIALRVFETSLSNKRSPARLKGENND